MRRVNLNSPTSIFKSLSLAWSQWRGRRFEVKTLRQRLLAQARRSRVTAQEAQAADELYHLRLELFKQFGNPRVCATCPRGVPGTPIAEGGYCCGGRTEDLFSDEELASLRLTGTRPRHLHVPQTPFSGCLFCGPSGCVLAPQHRPNICLRFFCQDLLHELHAHKQLSAVEALGERMDQTFVEFCRWRQKRLDDELLFGK